MYLKQAGFTEVSFKTKDKLTIHGLWLKRSNARCTVICCAGFYPGRKEGIATMYALLSTDCNILLFDARGHGKSDGPLWSTLLSYGVNESKDIEAALKFVHTETELPIVLWGVCAGAYHAAHAILAAQDSKIPIAGLIFDSGWNVTPVAGSTAFASEIQKRLKKGCKWLPASTSTLLDAIAFQPLRTAVILSMRLAAPIFVPKKVWNRALLKRMHKLAVPTLFIHDKNDRFASFQEAKRLAGCVEQSECWWIEKKSSHACHHLKHASRYAQIVNEFIQRQLVLL